MEARGNAAMPLLDHFHPPVSERRNWEGFHSLWAAAIVEKLNRDVLGDEYFADMHVHVGSQVEVDVATLKERPETRGSLATAVKARWTPSATSLILPTVFPDDIAVNVFNTSAGTELVAAIELVSPANKDRAAARRAFAAKCVSYLTQGIGLIVIDVVTNRLANLHNEIIDLLGQQQPFLMTPASPIYAVAYRPTRQESGDQIELWPHALLVGEELPTLALALRNAATVPVDLEATYMDARLRGRM
jgi:hypothetical protein